MNGHVGRDADGYGGVHGGMGFGTRNAEGERILEFGHGDVQHILQEGRLKANYLPVWRQSKYN